MMNSLLHGRWPLPAAWRSPTVRPSPMPAQAPSDTGIQVRDLRVERQGRTLVDRAHLDVAPGTVHALVGPNGAGKSTLLSVLAGETRQNHGQVTWSGRPLDDWCPNALARCRGVLPQEAVVTFPLTAWEVAEMGRLPHRTPEQDTPIVHECLERAGVLHLSGRDYRSLSGGERQRVQMARVMAQVYETGPQRPGVLLLDEPTSALDVRHQLRLMELLRTDAARGRAILVVLHDLNLAAAFADCMTILEGGRVADSGAPRDVLVPATIRRVWGVDCVVETDTHTQCPWVRLRYGTPKPQCELEASP
ncbi:heme ABC transporter ATP-binding protein [Ectothiorhodospira variabilis]|uniref:heme ABC transporter ATP-binding protein n=2 Tax=Ectothiorhodospira variabilis TaxID=505694 RepID=UPI001EFC1247|nr:heme ABC transporter ATP-binding protein [Ectothiorhodospira variabilis]MCG5493997.1 heme ABC transporter ATP-binding protein [Ectothiorhodospira variabilis]MCG5503473.1 heme ABC transporter ATP-binding protein [Ectothiorhodospira variabilis]MCG5506439.1 heme ABC transporter ATP-binding protein [Ectothiorhodospira variabilis]